MKKITIERSKCLVPGSVTFEAFLTAIFGSNGVGKSTLLNVVRICSEGKPESVPISARLTESRFLVEFSAADAARVRTVEISADGVIATSGDNFSLDRTVYLDAATEVKKIQRLMLSDIVSNLAVEGEPARETPVRDLAVLSRLARKNYTKIVTYDVEVATESEPELTEVVPFFQVEEDGRRYSSSDMGLGELALHYVFWKLEQIAADSLIILEEPDVYLAPYSQISFLDHIAFLASKAAHQVVFASHSSVLMDSVPQNAVRHVFRKGGQSLVVPDRTKRLSEAALGVSSDKQDVLFVEDAVAEMVLNAALIAHPLEHLRLLIKPCDGESRVAALMENLPIFEDRLFVCCYDGDRKKQRRSSAFIPSIFLPGTESPDRWLKGLIKGSADKIADRLQIDSHIFHSAIDAMEGEDAHDWISGLSRIIDRDVSELVHAAVLLGGTDEAACVVRSIKLAFAAVEIARRGVLAVETFVRENLDEIADLITRDALCLPTTFSPILDRLMHEPEGRSESI